MQKRGAFGILLFILGVSLLFFNSIYLNITGAIIVEYPQFVVNIWFFIVGMLFMVIGAVLTTGLEDRLLEHQWKRYEINPERIYEDVEAGYLSRKDISKDLTPLQERIERAVTGGKTIEQHPHRKRTYEEQFATGHAALGGRIIEVGSHLYKPKRIGLSSFFKRGRLMHFNKPTSGRYIWIVDEKGNFVVGNRESFEAETFKHKLPHATLAKGGKVYGSGEVLIEKGLVKAYNTASGHYVDFLDIDRWNKQGKEVFNYFKDKLGWREVRGGAKYEKKHESEKDAINY